MQKNENYKSIIKKKDRITITIVFLAKTKLNTIKVLIHKVLIDSYIIMTNLFQ